MDLGTLTGGLGCFPLDHGPYRPQSDSRAALVGIRSLIGLSPLATAHPGSFQPTAVRASTRSYPSFTLAMASSLGFGSTPGN